MTPVTAFDTDVLINAAVEGHPLGARVLALFTGEPSGQVGVGSALLLAEVLAKPLRADPTAAATDALVQLVSRVDLVPLDDATGRLALAVAVRYGLRAADAAHLATAISSGADRFLTNNRRDFPKSITEIEVIYPEDLPDPQMSPSVR